MRYILIRNKCLTSGAATVRNSTLRPLGQVCVMKVQLELLRDSRKAGFRTVTTDIYMSARDEAAIPTAVYIPLCCYTPIATYYANL